MDGYQEHEAERLIMNKSQAGETSSSRNRTQEGVAMWLASSRLNSPESWSRSCSARCTCFHIFSEFWSNKSTGRTEERPQITPTALVIAISHRDNNRLCISYLLCCALGQNSPKSNKITKSYIKMHTRRGAKTQATMGISVRTGGLLLAI